MGKAITFEETKKYFTIVQSIFSYTGDIDEQIKIEYKEIEMGLCSDSDPWLNERYLKEGGLLTFLSQKSGYCSNPKTQEERESLFSKSSSLKPPYQHVEYKIYPCSLPNPSDCKSMGELATSFIIMGET